MRRTSVLWEFSWFDSKKRWSDCGAMVRRTLSLFSTLHCVIFFGKRESLRAASGATISPVGRLAWTASECSAAW